MPDRRRHNAAWQATLNRLEPRLRVRIARVRTAFLREAADAYEHNTSVPGWVAEKHRRGVKNTLAEHYEQVAPLFARMLDRQVKSRRTQRKAASRFLERMHEWIGRESLRKAQMIAATDLDDVRDAIHAGIDGGEGTADIARRIRKGSAITAARAATVARTETNAAATFGYAEAARDAEQELGVRLLKVWLPTNDDRTRDDHRTMADHPPIPLNERFTVGGALMDRPGDPSGPPEQVINCRCALAVEEATN